MEAGPFIDPAGAQARHQARLLRLQQALAPAAPQQQQQATGHLGLGSLLTGGLGSTLASAAALRLIPHPVAQAGGVAIPLAAKILPHAANILAGAAGFLGGNAAGEASGLNKVIDQNPVLTSAAIAAPIAYMALRGKGVKPVPPGGTGGAGGGALPPPVAPGPGPTVGPGPIPTAPAPMGSPLDAAQTVRAWVVPKVPPKLNPPQIRGYLNGPPSGATIVPRASVKSTPRILSPKYEGRPLEVNNLGAYDRGTNTAFTPISPNDFKPVPQIGLHPNDVVLSPDLRQMSPGQLGQIALETNSKLLQQASGLADANLASRSPGQLFQHNLKKKLPTTVTESVLPESVPVVPEQNVQSTMRLTKRTDPQPEIRMREISDALKSHGPDRAAEEFNKLAAQRRQPTLSEDEARFLEVAAEKYRQGPAAHNRVGTTTIKPPPPEQSFVGEEGLHAVPSVFSGPRQEMFENLAKGLDRQLQKETDPAARVRIAKSIMVGENRDMKTALKSHLAQVAPDVHAQLGGKQIGPLPQHPLATVEQPGAISPAIQSLPAKPTAAPKMPGATDEIPRVSNDEFVAGNWDMAHEGLASETVATKMAQGMKGIHGREYGIREHSPGKWQMVSRPMTPTSLSGGETPEDTNEKVPGAPQFIPHPTSRHNPQDFTTVLADPKRLDAELAKNPQEYIPPGGGGAEIEGRLDQVRDFVKSGKPIEQPDAVIDANGNVALNDGRHRARVLTDMGLDKIPLTVNRADAERVQQAVGVGTGSQRMPESPEFASNVLSTVGNGTPGVSVHDVNHKIGNFESPGKTVVYRDQDGKPVAVAHVVDDGSGWAVKDFATDKSRGLLSGKAAVEVANHLKSIGATRPSGTMSPDAANLLERMSHREQNHDSPAMQKFLAKMHADAKRYRHDLSPQDLDFLRRFAVRAGIVKNEPTAESPVPHVSDAETIKKRIVELVNEAPNHKWTEDNILAALGYDWEPGHDRPPVASVIEKALQELKDSGEVRLENISHWSPPRVHAWKGPKVGERVPLTVRGPNGYEHVTGQVTKIRGDGKVDVQTPHGIRTRSLDDLKHVEKRLSPEEADDVAAWENIDQTFMRKRPEGELANKAGDDAVVARGLKPGTPEARQVHAAAAMQFLRGHDDENVRQFASQAHRHVFVKYKNEKHTTSIFQYPHADMKVWKQLQAEFPDHRIIKSAAKLGNEFHDRAVNGRLVKPGTKFAEAERAHGAMHSLRMQLEHAQSDDDFDAGITRDHKDEIDWEKMPADEMIDRVRQLVAEEPQRAEQYLRRFGQEAYDSRYRADDPEVKLRLAKELLEHGSEVDRREAQKIIDDLKHYAERAHDLKNLTTAELQEKYGSAAKQKTHAPGMEPRLGPTREQYVATKAEIRKEMMRAARDKARAEQDARNAKITDDNPNGDIVIPGANGDERVNPAAISAWWDYVRLAELPAGMQKLNHVIGHQALRDAKANAAKFGLRSGTVERDTFVNKNAIDNLRAAAQKLATDSVDPNVEFGRAVFDLINEGKKKAGAKVTNMTSPALNDKSVAERRAEHEQHVREVTDPAKKASEGQQKVSVSNSTWAEYEVAPLPDGRFASKYHFQDGKSQSGRGVGWTPYPTRQEALDAVAKVGRQFYTGKSAEMITKLEESLKSSQPTAKTAKIERLTPKAGPEEMVRLFRGASEGERADSPGKWWSEHPQYASRFGKQSQLFTTEVPRSFLDKHSSDVTQDEGIQNYFLTQSPPGVRAVTEKEMAAIRGPEVAASPKRPGGPLSAIEPDAKAVVARAFGSSTGSGKTATITDNLEEGLSAIPSGAEIRVTMKDGTEHTGELKRAQNMPYIDRRGDEPLLLMADDLDQVKSITQLRSTDEVLAAKEQRKYGEIVYKQPTTRDEYESTLWDLARQINHATDGFRKMQIEAQFNKVADEIQLAQSKRKYMQSVGGNGKPAELTHPLKLYASPLDAQGVEIPKPTDFNPDAKERRKKSPRPVESYEPKSVIESSLSDAQSKLRNGRMSAARRMKFEAIVAKRQKQLERGQYREAQEQMRLTKKSEPAPAPEKPAEPMRLTKAEPAPYRDWRFKNTAKNAGTIVPNRPGQKFTAEQVTSLTSWLKGRGLDVKEAGPTKISINDPKGDRLDLASHGAAGVKQETQAAADEKSKADDAAQKLAKQQAADSRESADWINTTFGDGVINPHNRNALSDYLEGKTEKFAGLVDQRWKEGVERAGALTPNGKGIDWPKLRAAYQQTRAVGGAQSSDAGLDRLKALKSAIKPPAARGIDFSKNMAESERVRLQTAIINQYARSIKRGDTPEQALESARTVEREYYGHGLEELQRDYPNVVHEAYTQRKGPPPPFADGDGYSVKKSPHTFPPQWIFKDTKSKKEIGEIQLAEVASGKRYEVANIMVWPEFQRKRWATKFYQEAEKWAALQGKPLYISKDRTEDAKALHDYFSKIGVLTESGQIKFPKGTSNAVTEGNVTGRDIAEHSNGNRGGQTTEASGGDRAARGGEVGTAHQTADQKAEMTWADLPEAASRGFESNVMEPLRAQVETLDKIANNPMLGMRYAWEAATKNGVKPGDPPAGSGGLERWKAAATAQGLNADELVKSHPEYQTLVDKLNEYRAWGNKPVGKAAEKSEDPRIAEVLAAARRPLPDIQESFKLKGDDGNWYTAQGFPHGVKSTGEKKSVGFVFTDKHGVRYGTPAATREELIQRHNAAQDEAAEQLRKAMTDEASIASQHEYWMEQKAKEQRLSGAAPAKSDEPNSPQVSLADVDDKQQLDKLQAKRFKTAHDEAAIKILQERIAADPSKWSVGDGVGYRVDRQINRGFRIVEIDPVRKLARLRQVADTGLTTSGGDNDRLGDQVVHIADLRRDKKYDATPRVPTKNEKPHFAVYDGKAVPMDYVADQKEQFKRAAQRIVDNGHSGHVVTPDGKVYAVSPSSRVAKPVTGDEAAKALKVAGMGPKEPYEMTANEWRAAQHAEEMKNEYRASAAPMLEEAWKKGTPTTDAGSRVLTQGQVANLINKHQMNINGVPSIRDVDRGDFGAASMYGGDYWLSKVGNQYMVIKNPKDWGPNHTHERIVWKAIQEGLIESHPEYPKLSKPVDARTKDLRTAIEAQGGHSANSVNDLEEIRRALWGKYGSNTPTPKEIREVQDQMRIEDSPERVRTDVSITNDAPPSPATSTESPPSGPSPEIPPYKRTTPSATEGAAEREQRRQEIADLQEQMRPLEKEYRAKSDQAGSTPSSHHKKKGKLQDEARALGVRLGDLQRQQRELTRKQDLALIEDELESPRSYEHYLHSMVELNKVQSAETMAAMESRSRYRRDPNGPDYDELSAIRERHEALADKYNTELLDRIKARVPTDQLNPDEVQSVAEDVARDLSSRSDVAQQIENSVARRLQHRNQYGQTDIDKLIHLDDEAKQKFKDELNQSSTRAQDWYQASQDIIARAKSENDKAAKAAEEAARLAREEAAKQAELAERNRLREGREGNRAKLSSDRYMEDVSRRASKMKGTVEKIVPKGIVDENTERMLEKQVIDPTWTIEKWWRKNDKGEMANAFDLKHSSGWLPASNLKSANHAKQLLTMFADQGVDFSGLKDVKDLPKPDQKTANAVYHAWNNETLNDMSDEQRARAFDKMAPTSNIQADMVLGADELGWGHENRVDIQGAPINAKLRELAAEVPEFAYNPVFTVSKDKRLVFRDGYKFEFAPEQFSLHESELTPGQTIGINLNEMGIDRPDPSELVAAMLKQGGWSNVTRSKTGVVTATYGGRSPTTFSGEGESWSATGGAAKEGQSLLDEIRWKQPGQEAELRKGAGYVAAVPNPKATYGATPSPELPSRASDRLVTPEQFRTAKFKGVKDGDKIKLTFPDGTHREMDVKEFDKVSTELEKKYNTFVRVIDASVLKGAKTSPVAQAKTEPPPKIEKLTPKDAELQRIADGTKRVGDTNVPGQAAAKDAKKSLDLKGFGDDLSPMRKGQIATALANTMSSNGVIRTRHAIVSDMIDAGAKIQTAPDGTRRLQRPTGEFLDEKQIGKTAMDFAAHLQGQKSPPKIEKLVPKTPEPQPENKPTPIERLEPKTDEDDRVSWKTLVGRIEPRRVAFGEENKKKYNRYDVGGTTVETPGSFTPTAHFSAAEDKALKMYNAVKETNTRIVRMVDKGAHDGMELLMHSPANGKYRVVSISSRGDTQEGPWITEIPPARGLVLHDDNGVPRYEEAPKIVKLTKGAKKLEQQQAEAAERQANPGSLAEVMGAGAEPKKSKHPELPKGGTWINGTPKHVVGDKVKLKSGEFGDPIGVITDVQPHHVSWGPDGNKYRPDYRVQWESGPLANNGPMPFGYDDLIAHSSPAKIEKLTAKAPADVGGEPPLPSKKIQESIDRVLAATKVIRGKIDKKQYEKAYSTLQTHVPKLGIELEPLGTFFNYEQYKRIADKVDLAIGQKFGAFPTQTMRDLRDAANARIEPKGEPATGLFGERLRVHSAGGKSREDAKYAALAEHLNAIGAKTDQNELRRVYPPKAIKEINESATPEQITKHLESASEVSPKEKTRWQRDLPAPKTGRGAPSVKLQAKEAQDKRKLLLADAFDLEKRANILRSLGSPKAAGLSELSQKLRADVFSNADKFSEALRVHEDTMRAVKDQEQAARQWKPESNAASHLTPKGLAEGYAHERYSMSKALAETGYYTDGRILLKLPDKLKAQVLEAGGGVQEGRAPDVNGILEQVPSTAVEREPMRVIGERSLLSFDDNGNLLDTVHESLVRDESKNLMILNSKFVRTVQKIYPDATFHAIHKGSMEGDAVAIKHDGNIIGVIMTRDRGGLSSEEKAYAKSAPNDIAMKPAEKPVKADAEPKEPEAPAPMAQEKEAAPATPEKTAGFRVAREEGVDGVVRGEVTLPDGTKIVGHWRDVQPHWGEGADLDARMAKDLLSTHEFQVRKKFITPRDSEDAKKIEGYVRREMAPVLKAIHNTLNPGTPEHAATYNEASGFDRQYRIEPRHGDANGLHYVNVYDIPEKQIEGQAIDGGEKHPDYKTAAEALGHHLERINTHGSAEPVIHDPIAKAAHAKQRQEKEQESIDAANRKAKEEAEARAHDERKVAGRAGIDALVAKVNGRKMAINALSEDGKTIPNVEVTAYGNLGVQKMKSEKNKDKDVWRVVHVNTGMLFPVEYETAKQAKEVAVLAGMKGDWSFTDVSKFNEETTNHARAVVQSLGRGQYGDAYDLVKDVTPSTAPKVERKPKGEAPRIEKLTPKAGPIVNPYGNSPAGTAYVKAKTDNPGKIVLLKKGDFYELFGEDAVATSKLLGLTLTHLDKNSKNPIPMAGFPKQVLDSYMKKLVDGGQQVVIADAGS